MKRILPLMLAFGLYASFSFGQLSPELDLTKVQSELLTELTESPNASHQVYVVLADQVDVLSLSADLYERNASRHDRAVEVVTTLQAKASSTQGPLLSYLNSLSGVQASSIQPYWIVNAIWLNASQDAIAEISKRTDVSIIEATPVFSAAESIPVTPISPLAPTSLGGHEPGHDQINAPALWALGYTGVGTKGLVIDTGIDFPHPALKRNFAGNFLPLNQSWFDPVGGTTVPEDCESHGTHVTGIVSGLDRLTKDTIGVAFNSLWMGAPITLTGCPNTSNTSTSALQWALNPDGNAVTTDDMPDVVNNSWGGPGGCIDITVNAINALEAAGVAVITSAGNDGPGASTVSRPGKSNFSLVNAFAIGAVNINDNIAGFSSRGPTNCTGGDPLNIKPEVVAPGVNIRSSIPGNIYTSFSGTSQASPMTSGAFLLLREAFAVPTGEQIKMALYMSAVDLGATGEDNNYGRGIIDLLGAYNYLIGEGFTPTPVSNTDNGAIANLLRGDPCGLDINPIVRLENPGKNPLTSATISYSYSNGGSTGSFNWTGSIAPNGFENVTLPTTTLAEEGIYDISVELSSINGGTDYYDIDNYYELTFTALKDLQATATATDICGAGSSLIEISAADSAAEFVWYTGATGGLPFFNGDTYITPELSTTTSYYIASRSISHLGLEETGSGSFTDQTADNYLIFDANIPFTLKSVKVFPDQAGDRTIQLRTTSGVVIASKTVTLGTTEEIVDLNFSISNLGSYELGLSDANMGGLKFSVNGVNFPYDLNGLITITGSGANNRYPYFYDWEVSYSNPCERTEVTAEVVAGISFAGFTPNTQTLDLSDTKPVTFDNTSLGADSWLWNFGDGTTSTDEDPTHYYFEAGTYLVTQTATNSGAGCSDIDSISIEVTGEWPYATGIASDLTEYGNISIFPNPSPGVFNVVFELNSRQTTKLSVFDVLGKQVIKPTEDTYLENQTQLDLSNLSQGVYYLRIEIEDKTLIKKLMKSE